MSVIISAPELRICDYDLFEIGVVDTYDSFDYSERWDNRDSFELVINRKAPLVEYLTLGRVIHYFDASEGKIRPLVIKQVDVDEDIVTISGNDYLGDLFGARIALAGTDTDTGYDIQSGKAETVMRHYINANILEAEDPLRGDRLLRLESVNLERGGNVALAARFQTILEILASCCVQGSVGWEGVVIEDNTKPHGWSIEFRVLIGTDRTQNQTENSPIILSEEFGTAKLTRFTDTLPEVTVAIVAGQSQAAERQQILVGDTEATGLARRETYIDARDTNSEELMGERGKEALAEAEGVSIEVEYLESGSFHYGVDFVLGDIVTVDAGIYGAYDVVIGLINPIWGDGKRTMNIVLGSEPRDIVRMIRDQERRSPERRM